MRESPDDPVLTHFRAAVSEIYGGRVERMVLFGLRARGNAQLDSDYDAAVFLRDMDDRAAEMNRLADLATDILYREGGVHPRNALSRRLLQ